MIIEGMQSLIIKATTLQEASILEKQIYNFAIIKAADKIEEDGAIGKLLANICRKMIK